MGTVETGTSETRPGSPASHPVSLAGLTPGTILSDRYRIVAPLGRGGMGEVYRADDLRLGQPVALKFLPSDLEDNPLARDRLLAEVRSARAVSHPNVCRVYDVGEVHGRVFLTMEYIDGEDLASLLRRIGRLPAAKALEVARQLCAGLAAAHERGVLHRDLKPANVMLDGRGQARIADFGLAVDMGLAGAPARQPTVGQEVDVAGTLAYMAPERFDGAPATVQGDLYALGLVLYEIYTGRQAVSATTLEGWRRAHSDSTPSHPSMLVSDIEPAVERAILRCLEKDPAKRPRSAAQLAAALPGGDPLQAAIAAGETPSPELVAASGEEGTLPRTRAWLWFAAGVLALAGTTASWTAVSFTDRMPSPDDPGILQKKARDIVAALGYRDPVMDSAWRIRRDEQYVEYATRADPPVRYEDFGAAVPGMLLFCYRQSPEPLLPASTAAALTPLDLVEKPAGDAYVELDLRGRLIGLSIAAPSYEAAQAAAATPDWSPLFAAAGLERSRFVPAEPRWWPEQGSDVREAWEGPYGLRVEAAARHGRPVSFRLIAPWVPQAARSATAGRPATRAYALLNLISGSVAFLVLVALARRNVLLGRGDRRGAFRLAVAVAAATAIALFLASHWTVAAPATVLASLVEAVGGALTWGVVAWLAYAGLEPYLRRRWPHMLVASTRLLDGRWRDPLVGRSVLVGVLVGSIFAFPLSLLVPRLLNLAGAAPSYAEGSLDAFGPFISNQIRALLLIPLSLTMGGTAVAVFARLLLRRTAPALGVLWVLSFVLSALALIGTRPSALSDSLLLFAAAVFQTLLIWTLWRSGVLACATAWGVGLFLESVPWTMDAARWYAWRSWFAVGVVAALAFWGFRNVLGRQSAFPEAALDG